MGLPDTTATYQDLQAMLAGEGCALCRYRAQSVGRFLDALYAEGINDVDTLLEVKTAGGLCREHTRAAIARREPLATAALYAELLAADRRTLAALRTGRGRPRTSAHCPTCRHVQGGDRRARFVLLRGLRDGALGEAWRVSDGLCAPDFAACFGEADRRSRPILVEGQARALGVLADRLQRLIASYDYRFRGERPPAVAASWWRAANLQSGAGVAGPPPLPEARGDRGAVDP